MLRFIIKRLGYSVLVIMGVIVLTFCLFNVAAGDPAAATLGKNPTAQEVESLRRELGGDLPLFYGAWRVSEAFSSFNAASAKLSTAMELDGEPTFSGHALDLSCRTLKIARNFATPEESILLTLAIEGEANVLGGEALGGGRYMIPPESDGVTIIGAEGAALLAASFFRPNHSAWNSQFFRSLKEICSFTASAPYVKFLDFGRTLTTREPIDRIIMRGLGPSLALMLPIFFGELFFGIALALLATACKDTLVDRLLMMAAISMMSISYLVVIIFAQWIFAYYYDFFPVWGWGSWRYLQLPILVGIVCGLGESVRFYRSVFVNELNREYLRTATAKGCSPVSVYSAHLLRNAMIPVITRAGSVLPFLFTGSLLLESFFGIPGLGDAGISALNNADLQLLKALVVISALLFVVINLVTDIAYAWADPRIRLN